jgi:hypothetical protein
MKNNKYNDMEIKRKCLTPAVLENISKILGDTNSGLTGLTGSEIHHLLVQSQITDIDSTNTKWRRLYSAFANQSKSEKDEHSGFCNILKGLCGMFRNPEAHEPKIVWNISEQDALEILAMISYCHRRLDNTQKIR